LMSFYSFTRSSFLTWCHRRRSPWSKINQIYDHSREVARERELVDALRVGAQEPALISFLVEAQGNDRPFPRAMLLQASPGPATQPVARGALILHDALGYSTALPDLAQSRRAVDGL